MTWDQASGWRGDDSLESTRRWMAEHGHDPEFVELLNLEREQRVLRGDIVAGILPVRELAEMAAGFAAAALSGRAASWLALGRCYRDGRIERPITWPGRYPFADTDQAPVGAALRCFAEAAELGDRQGVLMFASTSRDGSEEARRTALTYLAGLLDDDPDGVVAGWYGQVEYVLGDATGAVATYERAASLGNADAMFELYVLHVTGDGVPADGATAREWLLKAAESGQPRALYNVGAGYATGDGFPQDDAAAVDHYERAAKAGNAQAAATLGVMRLTGDMVPQDPKAAAEWFGQAESGGFEVEAWLRRLGLERPGPTP